MKSYGEGTFILKIKVSRDNISCTYTMYKAADLKAKQIHVIYKNELVKLLLIWLLSRQGYNVLL